MEQRLQRIANQPGFHGMRAQSAALCTFATFRGYKGPLPPLFFVQKNSARQASPDCIVGYPTPMNVRGYLIVLAHVRRTAE